MEEHCPEPELPARGDYVIVAQALSQVKLSSAQLSLFIINKALV